MKNKKTLRRRVLEYLARTQHPLVLAAVLCTLLTPIGAQAQIVGEPLQVGHSCSYFGEAMVDVVYTFQSVAEAEEIVASIVDVSGLVPRFLTRAAGVPNAAAVIQGSQRLLLYNPSFIHEVRAHVNNRWAPASIIAHEIGHHLNGHTLEEGGSRPRMELEADYFSGFVLQKMGASLHDAQAAMNVLGSEEGSDTHPAKRDRLASIATGWARACEADANCSPLGEVPTVAAGPDSCEYAHDGACDEPNICAVGTDTTDCSGVATAPSDADSCLYANDGACDEPELCPVGTDTTDCRATVAGPAGPDSCQYAHDGACDEPNICPAGTDTTDCRGTVAGPVDPDGCLYANDGVCDEPALCPVGTDTTDCRGAVGLGPDSCLYANDGTCDEPSLCLAGTDSTDCRGQVASATVGDDSCGYAHDGMCDEPGVCPVGTDTADCRAFSLRPTSGSYDTVTLVNACPTDEIKVAVRFQDAVSDGWKNAYWLHVAYGEETPPIYTRNRYWYYVAVSLRDGGTWNAHEDDYAELDIGGEAFRLGKVDSGEDWGEQRRRLTCD